jgi:uroporphyrinogen-III synthase
MRRVLVLRPEPGASATVKRARELGLDASSVPLFEIEGVGWQAPDARDFDALLVTSANAVRYGGEQLKDLVSLRVYAVGKATADAAHAAGFDIAATGERGVDALLASMPDGLKLLHLCGADRRIAEDPHGEITPLVVYRSKRVDAPNLDAAIGAVALIHSPRAGARLAELADDRSSITLATISSAAAEASGSGWRSIHVAQEPTDEALLALAASLCNKPQPK